MKNDIHQPLLTEGRKLLTFASEEVNRAEEDVVNYLVCHNTRLAITYFLKSFLTKYNEPVQDESVTSLLEKCRKMDDRFSALELSGIVCSKATVAQNDCYCLDTSKLRDCVRSAWQIEQVVSADVPAY